ncbi:MAG: nucleotide exchange factor GrpE [Candidatus Daviesbacteria bacterium]|nr:nucleotide exchange factor GrpE [Candidatus Daviesbacteria bacterium]
MNQDKKDINKKCCGECQCQDCGLEGCSCQDCQCCDGKCCEGCQCGTPNPSEIDKLAERVKGLEDQLKRAVADYQNLEKRVAEGRSELSSWATGELLKKMLPILDHLEKAVAGMSQEDRKSGWAKGVEMAVKNFKETLKSEGLEEIKVEGKFNPSLHEAVDMKDGEDGEVLEVAETGYNLNGKILRPAKVIVGRESSNHPEERNSDEGSNREQLKEEN